MEYVYMSTNNLQARSTSATMSGMRTNKQAGFISGLVISLITCVVVLIGVFVFAAWAFTERQDYKNNSDEKASAAAAVAKEQTQRDDAARFAEEAKNPLKTHVGPDAFGGVTIQYPKTWSAYIIESNGTSSGVPMNNYFHPDFIANIQNQDNAYALRVQIASS